MSPARIRPHFTAAALLLCAFLSFAHAAPPAGSEWIPIPELTDEFDGEELDAAKWHDHNPTWLGRRPGLFAKTNVSVAGGSLHLRAMLEDVPNAPAGYHTFTTAAVKSKALVKYGYFEIKCRPMKSKASSAFWFYHDTASEWTEIDVFEICGEGAEWLGKYNMNAHVFRSPTITTLTSYPAYWQAPFDFTAEERIYALEWNAEVIRWYVDGVMVRELENQHWHQALAMNFDSETMPEWFGLPDPDTLPSVFSIDYIRSWRTPSLTWDNGTSSGSWNTTDANWTTLVWNNANPDDAVFENRNETVTLSESITAGTLTVRNGGEASGTHSLVFQGADLSVDSISFNGAGLGGTVDSIDPPNANSAANQSLVMENITASIASNIEVGRGRLLFQGDSSVTVGGGIFVFPGQAWQNLVLRDSASLAVGAGVDLRWVGSNVSLEGGTLTTPFVWGNATSFNGGTQLLIDGATLNPTANEPDFLRVSVNTDAAANTGQVTLGGGGATFETAGFDIGIATPVTGVGGIVKTGAGSLVLNAANTYQGDTIVNDGSLTVSSSGGLTSFVTGFSANLIGGTATLDLGGSLIINTATADLSDGNSWLLVDVANLSETYGAGFNVPGFTEGTTGVWTRVDGANTWTFTEATGTLVLDVNPNISTYVLETRGPGPSGNLQTVWTTNGVTDLPTGPDGNNRLNSWGVIGNNDRLLLSFDLSAIIAEAAGRGIVVRYVKLDAERSGWASGWASTSLYTANPFDPPNTTWDSSAFIQDSYIGDIGGNGVFTMTWDSRFPGTDPWNSEFDNLVPDVQGDIDNNRTADYLMRVNAGNDWSETIGTDVLRMTVEVEFIGTESPFQIWMADYPSIPVDQRGPGDDPDGDGVSNLAEFATNGDPSDGANRGLSTIVLQDTAAPAGNELTLVIAVRDGATFAAGASGIQSATIAADQLTYAIEGTTDLLFPAAAVSHVSVSDTAAGMPDLTGTAWEYHTFRLDASEGLPGKGFLRAKITTP